MGMFCITSRKAWVSAGAVLAVGAGLLVGGVKLAGAAEEGSKATPAAASTGGAVKLTKPWSEIASLSEEQKEKLHTIHTKALAQISEIEKQEKADCMAVLDDKQKTELKEAMAKDRKGAAERRTAKAGGPTTAPSK